MADGSSSSHREARIFDVPVHSWPRRDVLEEMDRNITGPRKPMHISITSSELMYHSRRIAFIPDFVRRARLSLCDSAGVAISAFLRGTLIHRFTGPMLMEESFAFGAERRWRHFFYGGADGVAETMSQRAAAKHPGFITAGTLCPPFRELSAAEEAQIIRTINDSGADVVWVGLGVVRQELWIDRFISRLNVPWVVGVGGAFDYHAGTVPRAPKVVRAIGMEWLYRLYKEPWRYKRIYSILLFGVEGLIGAITGRAPLLGAKRTDQVVPPEWKGRTGERNKRR